MTPQERLAQIVSEGSQLAIKGILDTNDAKAFESLNAEAIGLKAQIAALQTFNDTASWAQKSTGGLPLAKVESITAAGETVVNSHQSGTKSIAEAYGEGLWNADQKRASNSPEYRDAIKTYLRRGERGLKDGQMKALQEGIDTEGGFLVPQDVLNRVVAKEPTPTRVAGKVTQLQTSRDTLTIPRINYATDDLYTSGIRVTWTGEIPASSTTMRVTDPVFGQSKIPVYTAMLSIPMTNDMVEDTDFPVVSYISDKFAETIELLKDNMIINGSGQGQPSGILFNPGDAALTQPAVVKSGTAASLGSSSAVIAQNIANLAMTLPEQYDDNATYLMNKVSTANTLLQTLDSQSRPLWGLGYDDAGLSMGWKNKPLYGYPVTLSGFMPNIGTSTYPLIFGDLRGYYLVNRIGFSVQVLRELYAETNQILVLGRIRFGGQVVEPWRLKAFQCHI